MECRCPRMEGLIFPNGILSQSQCCSCIPQEWVTARARGKELHLFSFYALACLVHTVDRRYKNRPNRVVSDTPVFLWRTKKTHPNKKTKNIRISTKVSRAQNTKDCIVINVVTLQVFRLAESFAWGILRWNLKSISVNVSTRVSQWCAQIKCRHCILYHFSGLVKVLAHGLKIPPETREVIW